MANSLRCQCGADLKISPESAGRRVRCPACGRTLLISAAVSAAPVASGVAVRGNDNHTHGPESSMPTAAPVVPEPIAATNQGAVKSVVLRRMFEALLDPGASSGC